MRFRQGKNPGETAWAFAIKKFAAYILHWSFFNVFKIVYYQQKGADMDSLSRTENRELMAQARESLRGNWGLAVGTFLVFGIVSSAVQIVPKAGIIGGLIITGPMNVGMAIFALALSRGQNPQLVQIFEGFRQFGVALGAYLLMTLFVLLWSLLLIIPGIIAAFAYSQIFYIIAEEPGIGPLQAISKSKELMRGNKWKLFCLQLRFIGWWLLCILTFGIGILWLAPYMIISLAKFYDDIAHPAEAVVIEEQPM